MILDLISITIVLLRDLLEHLSLLVLKYQEILCQDQIKVLRNANKLKLEAFLFGSKILNGAYTNAGELYKKFVGAPHIESIIRLVGKTNLPLVVSECLQNMDLKIRNVLAPYVRELMSGMPPSSKLPIHDYGTEGKHKCSA